MVLVTINDSVTDSLKVRIRFMGMMRVIIKGK